MYITKRIKRYPVPINGANVTTETWELSPELEHLAREILKVLAHFLNDEQPCDESTR